MISDVARLECDNSPQIGPFHTNSEKFENAALFLRLHIPSTLNGAYQKRSSNQRDLRTPTSRFKFDGEHLMGFQSENVLKFLRCATTPPCLSEMACDVNLLCFQAFLGYDW